MVFRKSYTRHDVKESLFQVVGELGELYTLVRYFDGNIGIASNGEPTTMYWVWP